MVSIGIIIGSTRPNRIGEAVGRWVLEVAQKRSDAKFELIDLKEYNLPMFDESFPPLMDKYQNPHTKMWAKKIEVFDGFIFVTPEYNHSVPASLKNAIDYLHKEWNNKAAGFVSYGSSGGVRAADHLRVIMGELLVADVRAQVALSLFTDFENYSVFKPAAMHNQSMATMLDQVISWAGVLRSLRLGKSN